MILKADHPILRRTLTQAQHREAALALSIAPDHYRKISSQADNRMRTRTAKQQLADALAAGKAATQPPAFPAPGDGDEDDASLRANMLT